MHRRSWLAVVAALGTSSLCAQAAVMRVGLTPVFLDERLRLLQRWREYLEPALGAPLEFVQRTSYGQVMDRLRTGEVQFAWICGYPYVLQQSELHLVAVPQWRGQPLYQSYLIADAMGSARGLADLRGRTFAYSDPLSNSGFLYMQHLLRSHGEDPASYFARTFFTHSHRHVVEAVAEGVADAGSVDSYVWETLAELYPQLVGRTRVLARSPYFGFPPLVAGPHVPAAQRQAFTQALLSMPASATGRAVLAELRLDGFIQATPALFAGIAEMARGQG